MGIDHMNVSNWVHSQQQQQNTMQQQMQQQQAIVSAGTLSYTPPPYLHNVVSDEDMELVSLISDASSSEKKNIMKFVEELRRQKLWKLANNT